MSDNVIDIDSVIEKNKPLEPAQPHPIGTVIEMPQNQHAHVPQNLPQEHLISTKMSNNVIDIDISKYLEEQFENEIEENKSLERAQSLINISPNGKYLVIYNESEKGKKFVGWNVYENERNIRECEYVIREGDKNENKQGDKEILGDDDTHVKLKDQVLQAGCAKVNNERIVRHMCVSDDKILAYIYDDDDDYDDHNIEIINMNNEQGIELYFEFCSRNVQFCNFNLKGELIIWCTGRTDTISYYRMINIVCVYSIQSGKSKCQKIYTVPKEAEVISISKHDKIWFLKNNDLYEWDITTAYATIIYRNIYGIETKEIKIFNNEDYTCIRLKNERIVVYSIQLGFPIALFELKYLKSSKDSKDSKDLKDSKDSEDRKRDKLIERMYNLMTKDQSLSCLLLSLLDSACLNKLIRTRSDELIEPPKQDPSSQPNTPNQSNLHNLFYRSEHTNYRFVYHNHTIKVDKVEPSEELKANNYEHENTNFSELKEGKYHLEKGSMIWKFRMEELEKVSMNSKRSDAESGLKKIKVMFNNLLKDLDEKEPDAELMIKNLKEIWKCDDMSLEVFERLEKKKKSTEQEDKIQLIEKLINELKSNEKKQKIKIDLENYFIKQIKQINKKGSFDEGIKQSLVEKVIDPIQEKIIKYLNEDDYLRRFVIELQNDAKDIIKTIGGIFKEKHIEDLRKLKDDYFDENKRVVSELLKIRDLIKGSYIIKINKIIETNPDKDKRREKINELEKKFIKEIEITKIKLFVKKLLIKTKRSEKDFSTNVELTDDDIECILESMIVKEKHYNGITLNKTNDGIKELVKKIDKQKEGNTNEHEGVPEQIEQNFDIKELVKNLTKMIIKIGIIVNKPKTNRFGNLFQTTTSQLKEYIEGNKFEDLKEEDLSNINKKFNKFEILIEKLVKDSTKEIDKIESNKLGKSILENILEGENGIIIDKVEKAMIKESAKMFIEENVKIRINRAKETFIKSIETASEEQQESQKSKIIKESVNKFIEFIEELDKIEDINEIEKEVNNFITIEENVTTDGTEENNLKNATEIKNSVDEFIKWVNKKERITKFKKLENLIREIGITEIEKLEEDSIKPATDDFIYHLETKIEELERDSKPADIIHNIREFKIKKLANINERNEIINNIVIFKINDELVKDSMERISTFKKLENENSEWRKELKENFIKRKNKVGELAEDPKKFEFQITNSTNSTNSLKADRDLIRLFCDLNEESIDILMGQMINNDEIAILTKIGFFIFRLNKDVKLNSKDRELISLNYFYYVHEPEQSIKKVQKMIGNPKVDKDARHCCVEFLHMIKKVIYVVFAIEAKENDEINCNKLIRGWVSYVKNNNEDFLKNDNALLIFAIEANDLELIDNIYKKCLDLFNQDPENNKAFLSIITMSMELLNKYYPEYVTKFSSDTNMIIDSPNYKIVPLRTSHLYSFSNIEIVDLSRSIFWTKCIQQISNIVNRTDKTIIRVLVLIIFGIFEALIFFLTFPISFPIFYILSYFNIINELITDGFAEIYYRYYYYISKRIHSDEKPQPTITFIVPYIKFVSYPHDYDRWKELIKPKPSPFVKTINRSIYKTWNGEALINFKWNLYGKYYYFGIWILFTALLGCFTAATTLTRELIPDNIRERLLIASIILGFIHFSFEFRQFIYDPIEWILDPWNYFDLGAYLIPTCTSIYWLYTALESFGVYFVIIISVAKKIASFLIVLVIIIVSFAHAFFILLKPRDIYSLTEQPPANNVDPNNPWKLEDKPNSNTNLFTNYGTSLFSMYLYLIGDLNSLSNWEYGNNPPLAGLMVLFSLLIAIYLMNLLIGLLSNAIEQDNNRASYFMQKAEILADIELFYLFPNQRRWKTWFPDVIYYHANFDETRRKVLEQIKNDEWNNDEFPEMKRKLLNKLKIHEKSNTDLLEEIIIYNKDLLNKI